MRTLMIELPAVVSMKAAQLPARNVTLTDVAAQTLFEYGVTRWLNDRTGGADQTEAERMERAEKAIAALLAGEVRSGGKRLDWFTKAAREIVRPYMVQAKIDKDEISRLIVKDPREAFSVAIHAMLDEKYGAENVTDEMVEDKVAANWAKLEPQIEAKAAALAEADRIAKSATAEGEIEI